MRRKLAIRIFFAVICIFTVLFTTALPVLANSAQSKFEGVDSSGAIMPDSESPIVVESELLTFYIDEFPDSYYYYADNYAAYDARVTAEYTFYNPSEYTVTATLLFPFGKFPSYVGGYYDEVSGEYLPFDDTEKYGITLNGEPVETKIRYTYSDDYSQFELDRDLPLITDGFVSDEFYSTELQVTKYTFKVIEADIANYQAQQIAIDIPSGLGDFKIYFPEQNSCHIQNDGDARIHTGIGKLEREFDLYVFGTPPEKLPEWRAYRDGGVLDSEEIYCKVELINTETMSFLDFALQDRSEQSLVSESDWYNAAVAQLNESQSKNPSYPVVYWSRYDSRFESKLMRWYEYEITFAAGERVVNTVTAPIYPAIDLDYEPDIYTYTYLLSPAKTWKSFGELDVVINTSYYITESSIEGFERTDSGYRLHLDGLPDGELTFTLCTSESPQKQISPYAFAFGAIIAALIIVPLAVIGLIILVIRAIGKRLVG